MTVSRFLAYIGCTDECPKGINQHRFRAMLKWLERATGAMLADPWDRLTKRKHRDEDA